MLNRRKLLIYLAAPYSAANKELIEANIRFAEQEMIELLKKGYSVICPHKNTAHLHEVMPWAAFMEMSFTMIQKCDAAFFRGGWSLSRGCWEEYQYCLQNQIPAFTETEALEEYVLNSEKLRRRE